MKQAVFLPILIAFLFLSSSANGEERLNRVYPFPLLEAEEVLGKWMILSGFELSKKSVGSGQTELRGVKENGEWVIRLQSQSPLACHIQAQYKAGGRQEEGRVSEMWAYLDRYLTEAAGGGGVPSAVLARASSVVCIKAKVATGEVKFSGFMIDKNGLILSTAHDLNGLREITIALNNGGEPRGDLVKIDPPRDLILINSHVRHDIAVSLENGRSILKNGERVYTIGCPVDTVRTVYSGVVDGPLRHAGGWPLWQVEMALLPGSSGSPVFDSEGNFVAVAKGRYRGTDSVGFLIPMETVMDFLKEK